MVNFHPVIAGKLAGKMLRCNEMFHSLGGEAIMTVPNLDGKSGRHE
jgi:hypothetical protein